jgi:PEGA domain
MSPVTVRRTFMPLLVVVLLSSTSAADRAVTVVGDSTGKELETVTAAAREAVERASWTVVAHDLPPERVSEVIRCSTDGDSRCIGQLLDDVGADRLIALKLADEHYRDRPVRVVYGTILRRGADVLASSQRYCESCRDELLADHVRSLVMDLVRGARSKVNPATLVVRSVPSGARVKLDGETVGPTDLELPIRAGVHTLEIALKDYQPFSQEIAVSDGQRQKLEVRLVPADGARRAGDHDVGTGSVPVRLPKQQRLAPWLAIGVGAALAIGGAILIAVDEDEIRHGTVVPGYRDTATGGAALATTGVVAIVAGAAWLISGRF